VGYDGLLIGLLGLLQIADENPDLTLSFVKDMLIGIEEIAAGDASEYKLG